MLSHLQQKFQKVIAGYRHDYILLQGNSTDKDFEISVTYIVNVTTPSVLLLPNQSPGVATTLQKSANDVNNPNSDLPGAISETIQDSTNGNAISDNMCSVKSPTTKDMFYSIGGDEVDLQLDQSISKEWGVAGSVLLSVTNIRTSAKTGLPLDTGAKEM